MRLERFKPQNLKLKTKADKMTEQKTAQGNENKEQEIEVFFEITAEFQKELKFKGLNAEKCQRVVIKSKENFKNLEISKQGNLFLNLEYDSFAVGKKFFNTSSGVCGVPLKGCKYKIQYYSNRNAELIKEEIPIKTLNFIPTDGILREYEKEVIVNENEKGELLEQVIKINKEKEVKKIQEEKEKEEQSVQKAKKEKEEEEKAVQEAKEEKKRLEKRKEWIKANGSSYLKTLLKENFEYNEILEKEVQSFTVKSFKEKGFEIQFFGSNYGDEFSCDLVTPTENELQTILKLKEIEGVKSTEVYLYTSYEEDEVKIRNIEFLVPVLNELVRFNIV